MIKRISYYLTLLLSIYSSIILILFFILPKLIKVNIIRSVFNLTPKEYLSKEESFTGWLLLILSILLITSLFVLFSKRNIKIALFGIVNVLVILFMLYYWKYLDIGFY